MMARGLLAFAALAMLVAASMQARAVSSTKRAGSRMCLW